jgi:hypothetical protein
VSDQAVAVKHGVDGADRWSLGVGILTPQLLSDLGRTPAWVVALDLQDQLFDLERQPIGVPIRPAAAVGEAVDAAILVALKDFVAGLAGDIELSAQNCHLLAVEQPGDETETLIHF